MALPISPACAYCRSVLRAGAALLLMVRLDAAHADITFKLDRARAAPGDTVMVQGVYVNDGEVATSWQAPTELNLQWRAADGSVIRSRAYLDVTSSDATIPVNSFARMTWRAVVPQQAAGLQAVTVQGDGAMMALDTGAQHIAPVANHTPTVDSKLEHTARQEITPVQSTQVASSLFEHFHHSLSPYEPMYFDFGLRGGADARFQISFKHRLFTPDNPAKPSFINNLYLGYTQTALWDLAGHSKPFIETTYNPSLFWLSDKVWESPQRSWHAGFSGGVAHISNGKGGGDSRSLNHVFVEPAIHYRFDSGSTLSFAPRIKRYFAMAHENHDYANYAGHVDWKLRWAQDNGLALTARYRQGNAGRRATQLEAAWPLKRTFLNMNGYLHLHYFNGYGETLLGYKQRQPSRLRIGLSLVP